MTENRHQSSVASGTSLPVGIILLCGIRGLGTLFTGVLGVRLITEGGLTTALGLGVLLLASFEFIVIYGLLTLEPWGWKLAFLYYLGSVLLPFVLLEPITLLQLLTSIAILVYLARHEDTYLST